MQLIAVDIGNSSTKVMAHDEQKSSQQQVLSQVGNLLPPAAIAQCVPAPSQPAFWSISSVNGNRENELRNWISANRQDDVVHTIQTSDVPLDSNVESREQLGRDRLVAAWAAVRLNGNSGPVIVVDAGTAVTIDWVDENRIFQGGFIFPGADSSLQILNQNTHALPDLSNGVQEHERQTFAVGKSTASAILKGVKYSQVHAIKGVVGELRNTAGKGTPVYSTGGLMKSLESSLPTSWNFVDDLVLRGATEIGHRLLDEKATGTK